MVTGGINVFVGKAEVSVRSKNLITFDDFNYTNYNDNLLNLNLPKEGDDASENNDSRI
jgi:hypothetical protein